MASTSVHLLLAVLAIMGLAEGQLCRTNVTTFVFESFDCFKDRHLKCTGDCISTADGKLNLTSYDTRSWGRLMYSPGIRLRDAVSTQVAYFSTNFTFTMKGDYYRPGEGLAFVMQANPQYQGHGGGFLGLYNKDGKAGTPTVAVEFDTYRDWFYGFFMYKDINSNHVGLDIESINSRIQVDAGLVGIDLGKERSVTAWIDYVPASSNSDGNLQVRISTNTIRPFLPLLSYNIDLSKHISEVMYLGFSAATGDHLVASDCLSYHNILSWGFNSWGLGPNSPPPGPPRPIIPPPPSVLPPVPLTPEPPSQSPSWPARPPLTPDAPSPSPSDFSPPAPAPVSSPSPSQVPMPSPPSSYPTLPPSPFFAPVSPPDSPVPVPSPDASVPSLPNIPAPSPALHPPPAISPSSPPPADEPSLPPESIPSPSAGPAPSSYVSPPAPLPPAPGPVPSAAPSPSSYVSPPADEPSSPPESIPSPSAGPAPSSYVSPPALLPPAPEPMPSAAPSPSSYVSPAPASTPTSSRAPSPSASSPNSTVAPSSEPPFLTPTPSSLPGPAPSSTSTPVPAPAPGRLDATRPMTASIAGCVLLLSGYALLVYNKIMSELGDGSYHSHSRVGYLGDQTMIGMWPATR